ncbi:MAG: hypothetical protein PCFJNLEI_00775 [Verrucomicrobiae bacterium]|nr:hypothetical protein [Verrucomicrobiae bacterium]
MVGSGAALFVLVVALLLDAYFHFGTVGRWIGFGLIVAPVAAAVGLAVHAWRRPISEASVARRIEVVTTGARNVLISAIQFDRELPAGSAMREALFAEMNDPFPGVQWRAVFDWRLLQKLGVGLAVVVAVLLGWAAISPAHFANSAARLFLPASAIAPLTRTQIVSLEPGNAQIVHGGDFSVRAQLGGEVPREAWMVYREVGSSWQKLPMNREVGQPVFTYRWKEVTQPLEFAVNAGDTRSAVFRVAVRPKTAVRAKTAEIEPPAYTQLEKLTVADFNVLQNILPGSRVSVQLDFNYPLADLQPRTDIGVPLTSEQTAAQQWRLASRVLVSQTVQLTYRDTDGFTGTESFPLAVKADEAPRIQITNPVEGRQLVATREGTLDVAFTVTDDFGLGVVALYRSTASAQAGELVQEWKDATGLRTFTGNHRLELRKFVPDDNNRLSFVIIAKDQNDVTGPGVTLSRPIVILTQTTEQMQQQAEAAATKLQKSLEDLLKLQQVNLDETRTVARSPGGGSAAVAPLLTRQVEIGDIGEKLVARADGLAAPVKVVLQVLTQNEMKAAVLALRSAASATGEARAKSLQQAIELEQLILARLQGTPDLVKAGVQAEQLKSVLAGIEDLLRHQRELHRDTRSAAVNAAAALADRQDQLADEAVKVRDGLAKSAQTAPLADREFTGRLVQAAAVFGQLRIYEDMLTAAEKLQSQALSPAVTVQEQVIANLQKVLALLNETRLANALEEIGKLKETLEGFKDKLAKLEAIQRDIVEKSKEQSRKDEFDAQDKATAQEIKATKDLMAQVLEQMLTDAHVLPDLKPANELRSELVSIYEDVIQTDKEEAAAGKLKAEEIAVQKEESILALLENAKKISDDLEMWLPNKNEKEKWLLENFDTHEMPEIPMLALKEHFEDIVGDLLEEQAGLAEDANDANSNQAFAENPANGWDILDGPQPGFGAQGKSGNQRPNKNEQTGRSSGGRQGMSDGEMAADAAKNLEGSEVDTRRTKDPMQKGQIKDEDGPSEAKATGGGKAGAFSDRQGMDGNAPLRGTKAPRQLTTDALAVAQALLKEKAGKTYAQASLLYLRANGLADVAQMMEESEQALKAGRLHDFNGLHQKIMQRLTAVKGNIANGNVMVMPAGETVRAAEKQLAAGDEGAVPAQYKDLMAEYYRSLTQER